LQISNGDPEHSEGGHCAALFSEEPLGQGAARQRRLGGGRRNERPGKGAYLRPVFPRLSRRRFQQWQSHWDSGGRYGCGAAALGAYCHAHDHCVRLN